MAGAEERYFAPAGLSTFLTEGGGPGEPGFSGGNDSPRTPSFAVHPAHGAN